MFWQHLTNISPVQVLLPKPRIKLELHTLCLLLKCWTAISNSVRLIWTPAFLCHTTPTFHLFFDHTSGSGRTSNCLIWHWYYCHSLEFSVPRNWSFAPKFPIGSLEYPSKRFPCFYHCAYFLFFIGWSNASHSMSGYCSKSWSGSPLGWVILPKRPPRTKSTILPPTPPLF